MIVTGKREEIHAAIGRFEDARRRGGLHGSIAQVRTVLSGLKVSAACLDARFCLVGRTSH